MKPTVLLFDIDGTLISTGGVGRRALEAAFAELFGASACHFRFDGMTDRAIVRQGLLALSREASEKAIDEVLEVYLRVLELEVARADLKTYRIHAGMEAALSAAVTSGHCAVGLGTGNIRRGAYLKLRAVDLTEHHFPFGGFGCDHEDRTLLIRRGAERGAQRLGVPLAECRVVVIGDTPKDIAAATAIGAESVGVGTGYYTPVQLTSCGATFAFKDLSQPGALDALLGLSQCGKRP